MSGSAGYRLHLFLFGKRLDLRVYLLEGFRVVVVLYQFSFFPSCLVCIPE